jgi:hypothetical protein
MLTCSQDIVHVNSPLRHGTHLHDHANILPGHTKWLIKQGILQSRETMDLHPPNSDFQHSVCCCLTIQYVNDSLCRSDYTWMRNQQVSGSGCVSVESVVHLLTVWVWSRSRVQAWPDTYGRQVVAHATGLPLHVDDVILGKGRSRYIWHHRRHRSCHKDADISYLRPMQLLSWKHRLFRDIHFERPQT